MASADRLVLDAEVRDRMTGQLRKIAGELKSIGVTPGMQSATGWLTKLGDEAANFTKKGLGAAGLIEGLGVGGLVASASLGGLVMQLSELGKRNLAMKELARQTGLSVDQLNRLEHAGAHFSVGTDDMAKMVDGLASQMPEMARGTGNLFKELQKFPLLRQQMLDDYKKGDFSNAIVGALRQADEVGKKYGPKARAEFLNDMFPGEGEVAERLFGDGGVAGFLKQLEQARKDLNPVSPELLKAERDFSDAQERFNRGLENFENKIGPGFLAILSETLKASGMALDIIGGKKLEPKEQAELDKNENERSKKFWDLWGALKDYDPRAKTDDGISAEHTDEHGNRIEKKSAYRTNGRSLLNLTAFDPGAGSGTTSSYVDTIAAGTKQGFLDAWRQIYGERDAERRGFSNASWEDGGAGHGGHGGFGGHQGHGGGDPLEDGPSVRQGAAGKGMGARAMWVMSRLKALGWTDEAAASAVGEFMQESGVRSDGAAGDGGISHGLAQWNKGRWQALLAFAARRHKPVTDLGTQVDFFNAEARARYHGNAWAQEHDLGRAHRYGDAYEGFGDNSGGTRFANAMNALKHWKNGGANEAAKASVQHPDGHVRIDFHHHGEGKVNLQAKGSGITAKVHRWPMPGYGGDYV